MASRLELQTLLENTLGSENVYYQPPDSIEMKYPAIVYVRGDIKNLPANNGVYIQYFGYDVTVIDEDPDSEIVMKVSKLPMCNWNRRFVSDNLNHDVFKLYF